MLLVASGMLATRVNAQAGTLGPQQAVGSNIGAAPSLLVEKNETGLPLGGFTLLPKLQLSSAYDNNVFLTRNGKLDDALFTINPGVELKSGWLNHALDLSATSTHTRYASYQRNDTDQYQFAGNGSLTVLRSLTLSGSASYGHLIQPRGTPEDDLAFGRFILYDVTQGAAKLAYRVNRLLVTFSGGTNRYHYDDIQEPGGTISQRFRDHRLDTASARFDYEADATTSLFVSVSPDRYVYSHEIVAQDRSSSGYAVLGGVNTELTRLIKGEIGLGYLVQNFKQTAFSSFKGFDYTANITYTPLPTTTVQFNASRQLLNSGLPQVPGVLTSIFRLTVQHELTATLTLQAEVEHDNDLYRGIARTDQRLYLGLSGSIALRRFLSLRPFYRYSQRTSTVQSLFGNYHDNRLGVSLLLAP